MNTSKFSHGNIVLVKGQAGKSTVLIILRNDELEDGIAQVDHVVRDNLRVASGDSIWIYPCLDIEPAKRIAVRPIQSSITNSLFDNFLVPYFQGAYRPVHQGNNFIAHNGIEQVEFEVIKVDPPEFGIVTQDTVIHNGEPIRRKSSLLTSFTHEPIKVPFSLSLKLWLDNKYKNTMYENTIWQKECLCSTGECTGVCELDTSDWS